MQKGKGNGRYKLALAVVIALFIIIVIAFSVLYAYIESFNSTEWHYDDKTKCDDFTVTLAPRTGKTDSWIKTVETDDTTVTYLGTIYDATILNTGTRLISSWDMRINIPTDCFLNNAWCGKVEIHQNVGKNEKIQTLDLRNYDISELTLDYELMNNDLMIPLCTGDYLVYHPDESTDEYPIDVQGSKISSVTIGIILYSYDNKPIGVIPDNISYTLKMTYTQSPLFFGLLCACFVWILLVVGCTAVGINMKIVRKRFKQDDQIIRQSIKVFTEFFEAKDVYTSGHSQRVAGYTQLICEALGMSEELCRRYYYIGLMHDCGKCYIPDEILKKPGKLTQEEYQIIKSHTVKGADMLRDFTSIPEIREGVLHHHERYDGKGYPEGLAGDKIPLIGRIICIADSFDAMNSLRSYRMPSTNEYILSELTENSGKQFDPELIALFVRLINEGKIKLSGVSKTEAKV